MFFRTTLSALIIFLLAGCQDNQNTVTKTMVLTLFSDIKALYLAGDVDAMMDYYTDDIVVVANVTRKTDIKRKDETQTITTNVSLKFSKEKYKALIEGFTSKATAHTYDIEKLNITTEKGQNTATTSYHATETIALPDETLETKSFVELSLVKTTSGKLLISGMTVTEL